MEYLTLFNKVPFIEKWSTLHFLIRYLSLKNGVPYTLFKVPNKEAEKRPYEILYLLRLFSVPDEIERYKKDLEIP